MMSLGNLKDICSCGHYFTDHDGYGCNRIGCGCSWQQVGDDYGALPLPTGGFEIQCPDCGETYIGESIAEKHIDCRESNHGLG